MKDKIKQIRYSQTVEDIINSPPRASVRWGTAIVGLILLLILILSYLIKLPYIIRADAELFTENPPAGIVAKVSGTIEELYTTEGQNVSSGTVLAVMETTASYQSIQWLANLLDTLKTEDIRHQDEYIMNLPENPILGEIQDQYSGFRKSYFDYLSHLKVDYYGRKINAVREEIFNIEAYLVQLKRKEVLTSSNLEVEKSKYLRDSLLNVQEILPDAEMENSKQRYYSLKIELLQVGLEAGSKRIDLASKKKELQDLLALREEENQKFKSEMQDKLSRLMSRLEWWIQNYLLVAPIDGKVTFTEYWSENQPVSKGETVITVVPGGESEIIARLSIDMKGSGKVKVGQKVNIQLQGYPYLEYGMVQGVIKSKSLVPHEEKYVLDVVLPQGLSTFYGKELQFTQSMKGNAEIITDDMRLIERVIYPFRYLVEKNRSISGDE